MRPLALALLIVVAAPDAAAAPAAAAPTGAGMAAKQALTRQRVLDAAAAVLFASQGGDIEARPLDDPSADLHPPSGALALQARALPGAALARRMLVHVDVAVDGHHWRTVPVWFAVQAWREVWVARSALDAAWPLSADGFAVERREVTSLPSPAWPVRQGLDGWRTRTALAAGAVLTATAIEPRQAVARHQAVQVRVWAGPVELTTSGMALADARIGETVRVLNPSSRASFTARVVADGVVVATTEVMR